MSLRGALGGIGRTLIAAGILLLLFVAYQLWGTGLRTAQVQDRLEDDFRRTLETTSTTTTPTTAPSDPSANTSRPPSTVPALAEGEVPDPGHAVGRIEIPAIGLDWIFVEGVTSADLKKGPGHYPDTPLPGQAGNAALAGHRTTYGAPFNRIDELTAGDEILITTVQGRFRYQVAERLIVDPSQVEVLLPIPGRNTLTLTSCHPKYSARQRIIVRADLRGEPAPAPPVAPDDVTDPSKSPRPSLDEPSLSGEEVGRWPAVLWAAVAAAIWLAAWVLGRRWRRWPAYALGTGPFLVVLFLFFENVSRLLPANY
jgi:sortase A